MAEVLAYPLHRRRDLIRRQADSYARLPRRQASANLAYQLRLQGEVLARKGVPPEQVEAEVQALEVAIRAEISRLSLAGAA